MIPGDLSRPGLGVDQVAAPARGQGSQLGQMASMALWRLVSAKPCRSRGRPLRPGRVQDRLGDLPQKRGGDLLNLTAAVKAVVLGRSKSAVAIFWSTSVPDC